ncbi:hypothetical protein ACFW0P_06890 [Lysobacter soli]|uniref:hypothetical protein n=1 Tax=Lysobacter soli TaxID=453783 RepID=UPI00369869AD
MDAIVTTLGNERDASLSFSWLHQRVRSYSATTRRTSTRAEVWTLGTGIAMTVIGLLVVAAAAWLPARVVEVIAVACLALELSAFLAYFALTIRNDLPEFTRPRETHASEIDEAFAKWQALVGVVYARGNDSCGVTSPVAKRQAYKGSCKRGWVRSDWVEIVAG